MFNITVIIAMVIVSAGTVSSIVIGGVKYDSKYLNRPTVFKEVVIDYNRPYVVENEDDYDDDNNNNLNSEYKNNQWNHGEVPWDIDMDMSDDIENQAKILVQQQKKIMDDFNNNQNKDETETETEIDITEKYHAAIQTNREKLWLLLEDSYWKAGVSGMLKGMYIQLGTGNTIINELEDFDNTDVKPHMFHNMLYNIKQINNLNIEFELFLSITTIICYNNSKKLDIHNLKDSDDISSYLQIRRRALAITLCLMLIFSKNIKNAI